MHKPFWVILEPYGYGIVFVPTNIHRGKVLLLEFHVFGVVKASHGLDDPYQWIIWNGEGQWELSDWQVAEWEIDGSLKWDGCIDWQTNPECMVHGCSPRHAEEIAAVFSTVYHIGKRYMDLLGDDVPELPASAIEMEV